MKNKRKKTEDKINKEIDQKTQKKDKEEAIPDRFQSYFNSTDFDTCMKFAEDLLLDKTNLETAFTQKISDTTLQYTVDQVQVMNQSEMNDAAQTLNKNFDEGQKSYGSLFSQEHEDLNLILSQGGTTYTSLLQQVTRQAEMNTNLNQIDEPMFGSYMQLLQEPMGYENSMIITTSRTDHTDTMDLGQDLQLQQEISESNKQIQYTSSGAQDELQTDTFHFTSHSTYDQDEHSYNINSDTENGEPDGQTYHHDNEYQLHEEDQEETSDDSDSQEEYSSESIDEESILNDCEMMKAEEAKEQERIEKLTPILGQKFNTVNEARKFYNDYAYAVGFSITNWQTYKCKDRKDEMFGQLTRVTFKCSMKGRKAANENNNETTGVQSVRTYKKTGTTPPTPAPNPKRRRTKKMITSNCAAEMIVTLDKGQWSITRLNLEHNHQLAKKSEKNMLKSQVQITDQEKLLIQTFSQVNLEDRKIMAVMAYIRGDIPPYTKKHVSNMKNKMRKEKTDNDMMQVLKWFTDMQANDPMFFYNFDTDSKNKVKNIFWASGNSRRYYEEFGDCISFDTTYNTNKYNMKFAPLVGITGHSDNCLFGCAFLSDETIPTFEWLFTNFLRCMGNKHPRTIITDQDAAMRAAIKKVFPNTNHRNCFFHIAKKTEERGGPTFAMPKNKLLHDDLFDIMRKSITEHEFELLFQQLPQKYEVSGFKYLKDIWEMRKNFIPVYFKKYFYPFLNTTARSEGTNATFKLDVGPRYSIIRFMNEYKRISDTTAQNMVEQDYITRTTSPWLSTEYEFEKQAARLYNRKIFLKFQRELKERTKYQVEEIEKNKIYAVFKSAHHAEKDFRKRNYRVTMDLQDQIYICLCCKFDKDGLLCAHILTALIHCNIFELPDKYFIDRWRPRERKNNIRAESLIPEIEIANSNQLRFNILSRRLCAIASDGSDTVDKFNYVLDEAKKMEEQLASMPTQKQVVVNNGTEQEETLKDPDTTIPKGRPITVRRIVGIKELKRTKQKITCSHCQGQDHNILTCKKKHLPAVPSRKKNRTSAKNKGAQPGEKEASVEEQRQGGSSSTKDQPQRAT